MRVFDEIQEKLSYSNAKMARLYKISESAWYQMKNAKGNQHNKLIERLEVSRIEAEMSHRAFYSWIAKIAQEELKKT